MKILDSIRDRTTRDTPEADAAGSSDSEAGALGIAGYDKLGPTGIATALPQRSQVELAAIDDYERSHEERQPVLDKLRYLRGDEPVEGYDAMDLDEAVAAMQDADMETLGRVREYELKFQRRPDVLEALAKVRRERPADGEAPA